MFNKLKLFYKNHQKTIWIASIAILYTIFLIVLTFFHENWRDEAQAWLICRDLSFIDMIKQLNVEGHPILWYLILFPFTKLGFPYHTINIISAILVGSSIFVILKKAPFHPIVKILIMLSIPFLYQHSVIARNYALIPLIVSLLAIYYPQKNNHPFIYTTFLILLFNTHSLMLGLGIFLLLEWIYELIFSKKKENSKKVIIGILFTILVLALVISFYKYSSSHNSYYRPFHLNVIKLSSIFQQGFNSLHYFSNNYNPLWYKSITAITILLSIIFIFIFLAIQNKKQAIIFSGSIICQWAIYTCIIQASPHRVMTIVYIVLFSCWVGLSEKKTKSKYLNIAITTLLIIFFGTLSYLSIHRVRLEITHKYSTGQEIAKYIKSNLTEDYELIGTLDFKVSAILPYLNHQKAWNPTTKQYYSFINWNWERTQTLTPPQLLNNIEQKFLHHKNVYYIYSGGENEEFKNYLIQNKKIKILYKTKNSTSGEIYELYQLFL